MKLRIIESEDGLFYPQTKSGWFSAWKFFQADADTSGFMLRVHIETSSPLLAAAFLNQQDAQKFIDRVMSKADAYYERERDRSLMSVKVKRVVEVE